MSRRLPLVMAALLSVTSCKDLAPSFRDHPAELRGVWLTNVDSQVYSHRDSIRRAMEFLADHNFNAVFPVVWNKGFTLYPSAVMDSIFAVEIDPAFRGRDPLDEILEEAHLRKIAVIPWFEFGFSSSMNRSGGHLLRVKPGWAEEDAGGALLRKNGFEWMNAFHPEVQDFLLSLVLEVVTKYPVDGVQGDDRLPALPVEGGYSSFTRALYRQDHGGKDPPYRERDSTWVEWRAARLTAFAGRLYREVRNVKPDMIVSWAPGIYPWSKKEYLQDWPAWVRSGSADVVIPQVYRYNAQSYRQTLASQGKDSVGIAGHSVHIFPGILIKAGDYVIPPDTLIAFMEENRIRRYHGECFFFYEGLRRNGGALAALLRERYYQKPAQLPFPVPFQN